MAARRAHAVEVVLGYLRPVKLACGEITNRLLFESKAPREGAAQTDQQTGASARFPWEDNDDTQH